MDLSRKTQQWSTYHDLISDEKQYMTEEQRDRLTRMPLPFVSMIVGGETNNGSKNAEDDKFHNFITQGINISKQNSIFDSGYNINNELKKRENLALNELNRIKSVTSKVENVVKVLMHDCLETKDLPDMIKTYYKYTRDSYRDDEDNLSLFEDTVMIHPVHKTFYMYEMMNNTKTNDKSYSEEYKKLEWSGLSHIFFAKTGQSRQSVDLDEDCNF